MFTTFDLFSLLRAHTNKKWLMIIRYETCIYQIKLISYEKRLVFYCVYFPMAPITYGLWISSYQLYSLDIPIFIWFLLAYEP